MKTPDHLHETVHKEAAVPTEEGMEKYSVDEEQTDKEKRASRGCPRCGTPPEQLTKHGSVIVCPRCGTEPFEGGA